MSMPLNTGRWLVPVVATMFIAAALGYMFGLDWYMVETMVEEAGADKTR
jgi:hypothetical protein